MNPQFQVGDKVRSKLQGEIMQNGEPMVLPKRIGYIRKIHHGANHKGEPEIFLDIYWLNAFDYRGYIGGLLTRDCKAEDVEII